MCFFMNNNNILNITFKIPDIFIRKNGTVSITRAVSLLPTVGADLVSDLYRLGVAATYVE